jgi:hypothetical protein
MAVSYLAGGLHRQLGWFRTPERAAEYVIGNRATGDTIPNWGGRRHPIAITARSAALGLTADPTTPHRWRVDQSGRR